MNSKKSSGKQPKSERVSRWKTRSPTDVPSCTTGFAHAVKTTSGKRKGANTSGSENTMIQPELLNHPNTCRPKTEKQTSSTNLHGPHLPERRHLRRNVRYWKGFTLQSVNPALMSRSIATNWFSFAVELREHAHVNPKNEQFYILSF